MTYTNNTNKKNKQLKKIIILNQAIKKKGITLNIYGKVNLTIKNITMML